MSSLPRPGVRIVAGVAVAAMIVLALVASALSLDPEAAEDTTEPAGRQLNVVVVMTDDQEAASVQAMPAVGRRLVDRGTTFTRAFATFPLCCPSRVTFLTGQYAHNHGVVGNRPPEGGYEAFREAPGTLPLSLQDAGYRTGHIGRYLNGYGRQSDTELDVPAGWDRWLGFPTPRMYDYRINENGRLRRFGTRPRDYQTDVITRKATRFLDESAGSDEPFFLSIAPMAPHSEVGPAGRGADPRPAPRHRGRFRHEPLPTPPSFNEADVSDKPALVRSVPRLDKSARRALRERYRDRLGSLLAVDDLVRRIVESLRQGGELDDTLIVFTTDNGFLLGEHRRRLKGALYEESVRLPLILRGPGVPRGGVAQQVVGNIDLAATILEAASAEPGRTLDGQSLIPFARDRSYGLGRAVLLENQRSVGVRTRRFVYIEHPKGEFELYDLRRDPFQLRNRAADPSLADTRAELERHLRELRRCAGAECR